jgi:putative Mg2+ transporter-C (MgtC) family protein
MPELAAGSWQAIAVRLGLATIVGLALGFEREWRGHDAGLRTHALVALSSAAIMVSALLIVQDQPAERDSDPLRAVQGLAQAIGFIAGGLIFVRGGDVR